MAALKGCVKESNLLTRNVHKFGCRHLTQNAPGPIPGQTGTGAWLTGSGLALALLSETVGRGRGQLRCLTCLLAGRFKSLQTSQLLGTEMLACGGPAGAGVGSLQTLCSSFSSGKQLRDATSLGIKEEKED